MLGLQLALAQSKGSGSITGDVRNINLTGKVVMADGSPPPEPVAIDRVCSPKTVRMGYTDATGFFNLQLVETFSSMQDASGSGGDAYAARGVVSFNANPHGLEAAGPVEGFSTLEGCDLRASLPGFKSSSVMIHVVGLVGSTNVGTIVLVKTENQRPIVSVTSLDVPKRARKAYEKASAHLQKRKLAEARKELEEAVKLYPRYADAWTDLGWLYAQQDHLDEARAAFTQARQADDKFVPASVGLASVALRESKWTEAQDLSARATELDAKNFPAAFYYNAVANLQLGRLDKAEKSARMADQLDTQRSLQQVKLLLGTILDEEGKYAEAVEQFKLYLKYPGARNTDKVQQRILELEKLAAQPVTSRPKDASASVAALPVAQARPATTNLEAIKGADAPPMTPIPPRNWAPPGIDEVVPPVSSVVSCPAQDVIKRVSARAKELMDNLQKFTATERIEHFDVDREGNPHQPSSAAFKYITEIKEAPRGSLSIEEYRDGIAGKESFLGQRSAKGMVAHALLFHPSLIGDLTITCEGLGNLQGRPAWQLGFVQKPNRPFRTYLTAKGAFPIEMKGRAWAAIDSYQIIRVETNLVKPISEIGLLKDHLIIDYQPVGFPQRKAELWLPQTAYLYLDFANRRTYRKHSFSDFELFSVDLTQETKLPEGD
ncbi:MAG TPA: tetratricopeptide repeat protein [Terriglobales bacterium]|nr:tetratricopeptide repeat protein [Terriglobales bacterium]